MGLGAWVMLWGGVWGFASVSTPGTEGQQCNILGLNAVTCPCR